MGQESSSIWVLEYPEDPDPPSIKSIEIVKWDKSRVGKNYYLDEPTWDQPMEGGYIIVKISEDYVWKNKRSGYYYSIRIDNSKYVRNDSGKINKPSFNDDYTTFSFITNGKRVTFVREDITSGPFYNPRGWLLKLKY